MRTDVLGVAIDNVTLEEAVCLAVDLIRKGGSHLAATPNPEMIQAAKRDPELSSVLAGASLVLPDGIGVIYAAKILGRPLKGRVPGIEFASALMKRMAEEGFRLYLLGAKPGVAETAATNLSAEIPGLVICGTHDGYFQESGPVVQSIRESAADVVFVCLGSPKQEKWIASHGEETGAGLLIGLGGSLDIFAGEVRRAPALFQKLGLEWLYRLITQPSRIGRMIRLPGILFSAAGARIRGK